MKTLIIGGGLSGLALADALQVAGQDYILVESRARFGGRILTHQYKGASFDMGPAWFWPGQPRIATLVARLGLDKFDQYATGALIFEDETGQVQRGRGFASMQGSWRVNGGLGAVTNGLAEGLYDTHKRLNSAVTALKHTQNGIIATLHTGETLTADRVVLALPPRIAAMIDFTPLLPPEALSTLQSVSTWMAGQAKAVAVYDRAFWRDDGLSGDAQSRMGPMVEIHDASPMNGGPYALFGFIGVPAQARTDEQVLRQHVQAQLTRIFGPKAATPAQLYIKDWAQDPNTATAADSAPVYAHPHYGLAHSLTNLWNGRLHFSGTEVAPQFGGYIEGALEAAEATFIALQNGPID